MKTEVINQEFDGCLNEGNRKERNDKKSIKIKKEEIREKKWKKKMKSGNKIM